MNNPYRELPDEPHIRMAEPGELTVQCKKMVVNCMLYVYDNIYLEHGTEIEVTSTGCMLFQPGTKIIVAPECDRLHIKGH